MAIATSILSETEVPLWNRFVDTRSEAGLYQQYAWRDVIQESYRHDGYFLVARDTQAPEQILGILPLFQIKHWLFGNSLISIPYFDNGGILAATPAVEAALIECGLELAINIGATHIELRNTAPLLNHGESYLAQDDFELGHGHPLGSGWSLGLRTHKVRMLLPLPGTAESLLQSFKAKLRSQIRRPEKAGLTIKQGRHDLVDDFYKIFATNMRDLGSPVHSKRLFIQVLERFPKTSTIFIVHDQGIPVACALVIGYKTTLFNPWASFDRRYSHCSPNMLLYWAIIRFGYEQGYSHFDMGRCSPNESGYKFKEQWGAIPIPIYWYTLDKTIKKLVGGQLERYRLSTAIACWKHLPVTVTTVLGPPIRKYIAL